MKKMLLSLIISFLYLGISINTYAATKPVARLGAVVSSTVTGELSFHPTGCTFSFPFHITATNLGTFAPQAVNGIESLPTGYPLMFLEYSVDGNPMVRKPVTDFYYVGLAHGVPIYEAIIYSDPIDIESFCDAPTGINGAYGLSYNSRLVREGAEQSIEYPPYPISAYNSICDIFSCGVATSYSSRCNVNPANTSLAPVCLEGAVVDINYNGGDDPGVLEELIPAAPSGTASIYCEGCLDKNTGGTRESRLSNDQGNEFNPTVMPNPFSDNFEVKWGKNQTLESLLLFDTSGRLVQKWSAEQLSNQTKLMVDAADLETGVYYLKVNSHTTNEVLKIVKQ